MIYTFVSITFLALHIWPTSGTIQVGGPGGAQKMSFKAPDLTEEDSHSLFVPDEFKCDACVVVAYQMHAKFEKFNQAHKHYKYKLPESEILDLVEGVCKGEVYQEFVETMKIRLDKDSAVFCGQLDFNSNQFLFVPVLFIQEYGVKEVKNLKRLSGPGLDTKDFPGIIAGGGKWPHRLSSVCTKFIDEIGEEELYAAYQKNPQSRRDLENFLCRRTGVFGYCSNTKRMTMRVLDL